MPDLVDVFEFVGQSDTRGVNLLFDQGPLPMLLPGGVHAFRKRLDLFLGGGLVDALAHMPELAIAGGSVIGALTGTKASDLDIFIVGEPSDAEGALRRVVELVQRSHSFQECHRVLVTRSGFAVTLFRLCGDAVVGPPIQIVLIVNESVEALLADFDIDCCCFAYSPHVDRVVCNMRGCGAISSGIVSIDMSRSSPAYWQRLEKY
jgi:hypothetical protein